jgi:RNA polymerase sigma factor (sigma-70 family)
VTLNVAKDTLKEKGFDPLSEDYPDPKDEIGRLIGEDYFAYMISGLSNEERRIMIAKFVEKLTFKEIAEELSKNLNTISAIYYRALEKIKNELEKKDGI